MECNLEYFFFGKQVLPIKKSLSISLALWNNQILTNISPLKLIDNIAVNWIFVFELTIFRQRMYSLNIIECQIVLRSVLPGPYYPCREELSGPIRNRFNQSRAILRLERFPIFSDHAPYHLLRERPRTLSLVFIYLSQCIPTLGYNPKLLNKWDHMSTASVGICSCLMSNHG